jgi:Putative undecaprenyl diphosphate synthase
VTRPHAALAQPAQAAPTLHHVMVVGGTIAEWADMQLDDWEKRVDELGSYCASIGVPWLTVRVYRDDHDRRLAVATAGRHDVGGCCVTVDPHGDGRRRFAEAMNALDPTSEITEATVNAALYGDAVSEPDLLVVLGPRTQLPASLVWELAYAELVFIPVAWSEFGAGELAAAVVDFAGRRRRFGGLDDE